MSTDILSKAAWGSMSRLDKIAYITHAEWMCKAHPYQVPPPMGQDWFIWLLLAGRGSGKTASAAQAMWWWAWRNPKWRLLVLAPTSNDIKHTCFEGESGLLAVTPSHLIHSYNKQDHQILLKNGSSIRGISGDSYERLRGPQFHACWADELAAFNYLGEGEAWDMMMMGLRLGETPRVIVTTTPRNKELINELVAREGDDVVIDRASTYANIKNLSKTFSRQLEKYKGSKLYNQEVLGEIIDLEEGKVVSRSMFKLWPHGKAFPKFEYIVQSYDTAFTDKLYNDPTAMTTWGVFKPQDGPMSIMLIDCWAEHLTFPELKPKVIEEFNVVYGEGENAMKPSIILVEAKASGISLIQELQRAFLPVRSWNPGKADKMQRFQISASVFSTGRVWLPESSTKKGYVKSWVEGFLSQLCSYPEVTNDDYVDSASMAIRFLSDTGWIEINLPPEGYYGEEDDDQPKKGNPYSA